MLLECLTRMQTFFIHFLLIYQSINQAEKMSRCLEVLITFFDQLTYGINSTRLGGRFEVRSSRLGRQQQTAHSPTKPLM